MEWVFERAGGKPGRFISVGEYSKKARLDPRAARSLWQSCHQKGEVTGPVGNDDSVVTLALTPHGAELVQQHRQSRDASHAAAARSRVLRWIYDRDTADEHGVRLHDFLQTGEAAHHNGDMFTTGDVDRAARYLAEKGLIELDDASPPGAKAAKITSEGDDCITDGRGNVSAYVQSHQSVAPITTTHISTVINGNVNHSQVAAGQTVNQAQTWNHQVAPGFEAVAEAVADLLKQAPLLGLQDRDREDIRVHGEKLLAEVVKPEPDRSKVGLGVRDLLRILQLTVNTAVMAGAQEAATEVGHELLQVFEHLASLAG